MSALRVNKVIYILEEHFGEQRKASRTKPKLMDILIATKLSQNTTDKTSYIAFRNLKENIGGWEDVMNAPLPKIKNSIKVCGLANTKAVQIIEMLQNVKREHGNLTLNHLRKLSNDEVYDELLKHKGIGKKTISCLLAFGMGRDVFPVDTHVHRIMNRIGLLDTKTPDETFEASKEIVPDKHKVNFHTNLIRFGRNVCKALNPLCEDCMIRHLCEYKQKRSIMNSEHKAKAYNNFIILENV
ncbi:MAG: endonuclease III [Candidatus Kapaibacterium sp.]